MRRHVIRWYVDAPIQLKLLTWFMPLSVLMIAAFGLFAYLIASDQAITKVHQAHLSLTEQTATQVDAVVQDLIDFSNELFLSSEVNAALRALPNEQSLGAKQRLYETLSQRMLTRQAVQSLIYYSSDGTSLAIDEHGSASPAAFVKFQQTDLYRHTLEAAGRPSWSLLRPEQQLLGDTGHTVVLSRIFRDNQSLQQLGFLMLGISRDKLTSLCAKPAAAAEMMILDEGGRVLASTHAGWIGQRSVDLPFFPPGSPAARPWEAAQSDYLYAHSLSASTGWHIVVVEPRQQLIGELSRIRQLTVVVIVLCLVASLLLSWFAASRIVRPIRRLLRSIRHLQEGDFSQRVNFTSRDEIGQLGSGYNDMVEQIRTLIVDLYAVRLKQREAEYKALQAQINPHFLYNTLNTLYWTAHREGMPETAEQVYDLSQLFRLTLSDGDDHIPVAQELKLVEHYLRLQQVRFPDRLHYEIVAEGEATEYAIPKLLIQPLVENAILHGIEPLQAQGMITIRAHVENGDLCLEVTDNGVGIPEDRMSRLTAALEVACTAGDLEVPPAKRIGFALQNVRERLALAYHDRAVLHLESRPGYGTRVSIRIEAHSKE